MTPIRRTMRRDSGERSRHTLLRTADTRTPVRATRPEPCSFGCLRKARHGHRTRGSGNAREVTRGRVPARLIRRAMPCTVDHPSARAVRETTKLFRDSPRNYSECGTFRRIDFSAGHASSLMESGCAAFVWLGAVSLLDVEVAVTDAAWCRKGRSLLPGTAGRHHVAHPERPI